jgi:hypothetical protein
MPGVPSSFVEAVHALGEEFRLDDVRAKFPGLAPTTISVYLSQMVSAGQLATIGRGAGRTFRRETSIQAGLGPPAVLRGASHRIASLLRKALLPTVLDRVIVWGDDALAPYLHDEMAQGFTVVEAPHPLQDSVFEALDGRAIPVRNHSALPDLLWHPRLSRDRTVYLLPQSSLKGTERTNVGVRTIKPERLLVDVLRMEPLLPDVALRLVQPDSFDVRKALAIAAHHGQSAPVASFLTYAALHNPNSRVGHEMREIYRHLRRV